MTCRERYGPRRDRHRSKSRERRPPRRRSRDAEPRKRVPTRDVISPLKPITSVDMECRQAPPRGGHRPDARCPHLPDPGTPCRSRFLEPIRGRPGPFAWPWIGRTPVPRVLIQPAGGERMGGWVGTRDTPTAPACSEETPGGTGVAPGTTRTAIGSVPPNRPPRLPRLDGLRFGVSRRRCGMLGSRAWLEVARAMGLRWESLITCHPGLSGLGPWEEPR